MSNFIYSEILKNINACSVTGYEKVIKSERIGTLRITLYKDNFKQHRIVLRDTTNSINISAILFDQFNTVKYKHTLSNHCGNNYTKQLMSIAQTYCNNKFRYSDHMTTAGLAAI